MNVLPERTASGSNSTWNGKAPQCFDDVLALVRTFLVPMNWTNGQCPKAVLEYGRFLRVFRALMQSTYLSVNSPWVVLTGEKFSQESSTMKPGLSTF
jgi:hypothetical protein